MLKRLPRPRALAWRGRDGPLGPIVTPSDARSSTRYEALDELDLHEQPPTVTYCVAVKVDAGLVFASDSRTNAGFDQISTFRKMVVYERPGDRFMVLLSSGNLSISQSVREILQVERLAARDPRRRRSGTPAACSR